jgi:hypothetical protein
MVGVAQAAAAWHGRADTGRAEYAGGQSADPPAPGADPPARHS